MGLHDLRLRALGGVGARRLLGAAGAALIALGACSAPPPAAVAPSEGTTTRGQYRLTWTTRPAPVVMSELFEVEAVLTDAKTGAPIEDATVRIDARMPQHGHGMATRPEDDPGTCDAAGCRHPGGRYVTRGMKFHMPGDWALTFDVDGPAGPDRLEAVHRL